MANAFNSLQMLDLFGAVLFGQCGDVVMVSQFRVLS
jgi:hypothetical protein